MNSFSAADLPENKYFEKDALIDKKFIVCAPGVPISAALKAGLTEWNFPKVFSEGNIADASPLTDAKPAPAEKSAAAVRLSDELDALLEEAENGSSPPAEKTPQQAAQDNADAEMEAVRTEYARYLAYTESVYKTYAGKQTLSISAVSDRMKEFCGFLQKHRRLVLRMQPELRWNPALLSGQKSCGFAARIWKRLSCIRAGKTADGAGRGCRFRAAGNGPAACPAQCGTTAGGCA